MIDVGKIGEYIRTKRKALGMTQTELGNKLNTTCQNVSKWETGNGIPTSDMLESLSKELQCSVKSLLAGEDEMEEHSENELLEYGKIYADEIKLSDKIRFNKNGLNQILYKDTIYDYGDYGWNMLNQTAFYLKCDYGNPFRYKEILMFEAKSVTRLQENERDNFVSLKDLLLEEIENGKYSGKAVDADGVKVRPSDPDRTIAQSIVTELREAIYYGICDMSIEELKRMEPDDMCCYEDFTWGVFVDDVEMYEILEKNAQRYLKEIAEMIIKQKERAEQ